MTYLFWAYAVVWIGLFAYLFALTRRSRMLEHELRRLNAEDGAAREGADAGRAPGRRAGAGRVTP